MIPYEFTRNCNSEKLELALKAEKAGWDGFFIWDHISGKDMVDVPFHDPTVLF